MELPRRPKVMLIGWDAADWKVIHPLMDAGRMPHLKSLVDRGSMSNLATLKPVLSPMLWTSIATGKRPFDHGVLGFSEPTPDGAAVQPVSVLSRTTKAIWNILNQQGLTSQVVGWWPSHPVEPIRGSMVSNQFHRCVGPPDQPWPMPKGTVHPPTLAEELAPLRVNPAELGPEEILPFVPLAAKVDQDKDRRVSNVMKTLAECASVHNAATWLLANRDADFFAVYYDAIDHFCHGFMRYHPPRQDWISEADFELYQHVVTTAYLFHDAMLGAMLRLVGPETTVIICSDHGFHPDHLRPRQIPHEPAGPAVEHRDYGMFVIAGPGIRNDALLHGTSLLDVTPTILSIYGLPIGDDMHGKPLLEAFEDPPQLESIPSWDEVDGEDGTHSEEIATDPIAAREALEQLVELGYVEDLGEDHERAVHRTTRELRYNLARAYMDADRYVDARGILEELSAEDPSEYRFGIQLAMCLRALDEPSALRTLVEEITKQRKADARAARIRLRELAEELRGRVRAESGNDNETPEIAEQTPLDPSLFDERERAEWKRLRGLAQIRSFDLDYLMGWVCLAEGKPAEALEHLERAERAEPSRPGLPIQIGEAYLGLDRPIDALRSFEKALDVDPLNPHAHLGVARAYLKLKRPREAADSALEAVGLLYHYPLAHAVLGRALARIGRPADAVTAFDAVLELNPNAIDAHERLIEIFERDLPDPARAEEHRIAIEGLRSARIERDAEKSAPGRIDDAEAGGRGLAEDRGAIQRRQLDPDRTITIVSGMPRSGTSMMMQMLEAAGLEIASDGQRSADEDNPRGYFELDDVKRIRTNASFLGATVGKVVKVVAPLLPYLPKTFDYRIVFMERELEEVLSSQRAMLERNRRETARVDDEALKRAYARQLQQVKIWLARQSNVSTLFVSHRLSVDTPMITAISVEEFLFGVGNEGDEADEPGRARAVNDRTERMAGVVDAQLHRQHLRQHLRQQYRHQERRSDR